MRSVSRQNARRPAGPGARGRAREDGFSLIELMVATAVFAIILTLVLSITNQTGKIWRNTNSEIKVFQNARAAYERVTSKLSQSTLNTYLDYYDKSSPPKPRTAANASTFVPDRYARNSELHFIVGQAATLVPGTGSHPGQAVFFLTPSGFTGSSTSYGKLSGFLNACGFFVEFNSDRSSIPAFLQGKAGIQERYRFRLMEFLQPSESLAIYDKPSTGNSMEYCRWFRDFLPPATAADDAPLRALAENVIALVLVPQYSPQSAKSNLPLKFSYDSREGDIFTDTHHQLPPLVRVVMVAIDEDSARRLNPAGSSAPPSFSTVLETLFRDPAQLDADLKRLSDDLSAQRIKFRIFDSTVSLKGSNWSDDL